VLRDHFDAFVLRQDGTVIPIWKLVVPATVADTLLALPEALLNDVLEPYRLAAEHALTLARDPEHNGKSSQGCVRTANTPPSEASSAQPDASDLRSSKQLDLLGWVAAAITSTENRSVVALEGTAAPYCFRTNQYGG
jgi:hypothetical protein